MYSMRPTGWCICMQVYQKTQMLRLSEAGQDNSQFSLPPQPEF